MAKKSEFVVFADYCQFYVLDDDLQPPYPESVSDEHLAQRFQCRESLVAIYTGSASDVGVAITVAEHEPPVDLCAWEHVFRCHINAPSGRIALAGCTDYLPSCPRIAVPKGGCGMLVFARGIGKEQQEAYEISIWPSTFTPPSLLKRHEQHG